MKPRLSLISFCVLTPALAVAQAKPAPAPATPPPAATASVAPPAPLPESYTYDPSGRRDPFLVLLGSGKEPRTAPVRGEGKAGLVVAEVSVRGVIQSRGGFIAMVQGPDGRTFLIHQGDKLADGVVKTVDAEGIVVVQDVNDPSSLVKQREVSRKLRSLEAKP